VSGAGSRDCSKARRPFRSNRISWLA
jgi:hypothetical protein